MRLSFLFVVLLTTIHSQAQWYPVPMNDKVGYINESGEFVKPTSFLDAHRFSEGLAAVTVIPDSLFQKWYYVDSSLKIVIKTGVADPHPFKEGLAAVRTFRGWNYFDKEGNIAIKADYDTACDFYNGYARVKMNGFWMLIDHDARYILNPNYTGMSDYVERVLALRHKDDSLYHYFALSGDTLMNKQGFDYAGTFINGLGVVRIQDDWFYVNLNGERVIQAYVDEARPFYGELACVQERGHWYFMDKEGKINKTRELVYPVDLREPLTWVEFTNGSKGYVDQKGNWVYRQ